ncbi:MAG: hypothetical protein QOI77_159 [Blastocatellia bacterium]|jgi:hypothetical protein|nr:hypothetical protein [Blastocatellia bacterium]
MTLSKYSAPAIVFCCALLSLLAGCQTSTENSNATATTSVTPPGVQNLTVVPRPQKIVDMMKARGEQDQAQPTVKIISPAKSAAINGSTVEVKLELSGDLKGYMPHKDPATGKGNHIHVILDNQPYEAYYDTSQPFELRNVSEGKHTLRVFPSRPWHESYKNDGAFQMVQFTVKGGGDATKPTTTKDGQTMASPAKSPAKAAATPALPANANSSTSPTPAREGKDFAPSSAGDVDPAKPLLTYSRPKGEYKGEDADPIMIDFWLTNAKLLGDGGTFRVRYTIDGGEAKFIDKWEPIWLSGWIDGKHQVKLELVDKDGNPVDNGGYNSTTREITVTR